jgi:cation diffusion facilitator family transporter
MSTAGHHRHDGSHHHGHGHSHGHGRGLGGALAGVLRPHSHDAADALDDALESSAEGMRALRTSLAGLAFTAVAQLVVLVASGSVALAADTIHNFADALTAVPLGLAFLLGRRPANRRYTYGYGRSEDLAGICVVLAVAASAVVAGWAAVDRLVHPHPVGHLAWVAAAGVVGCVGNEVVARHRITVGRRIGSAALEADGHHARTDGLASLGVVAGAVGVALGWPDADPVFGLAITATILVVVRHAARDIYRRLMDAVDPALVEHIEAVLAGTTGVDAVDRVRVRWVGHTLHAEAEITSDAGLSLGAAHDVAEDARHELLHRVRRLTSVTIHTSPTAVGGRDPHARTAHHAAPSGTTG